MARCLGTVAAQLLARLASECVFVHVHDKGSGSGAGDWPAGKTWALSEAVVAAAWTAELPAWYAGRVAYSAAAAVPSSPVAGVGGGQAGGGCPSPLCRGLPPLPVTRARLLLLASLHLGWHGDDGGRVVTGAIGCNLFV
jgi:hypothetical protein